MGYFILQDVKTLYNVYIILGKMKGPHKVFIFNQLIKITPSIIVSLLI
jgi:hypothetical protein